MDHTFEQRTLLAQGLRPVGVVPDIGILQFAQYFL
jgi:hypothetical protein